MHFFISEHGDFIKQLIPSLNNHDCLNIYKIHSIDSQTKPTHYIIYWDGIFKSPTPQINIKQFEKSEIPKDIMIYKYREYQINKIITPIYDTE